MPSIAILVIIMGTVNRWPTEDVSGISGHEESDYLTPRGFLQPAQICRVRSVPCNTARSRVKPVEVASKVHSGLISKITVPPPVISHGSRHWR
jgi:hypothetical protein